MSASEWNTNVADAKALATTTTGIPWVEPPSVIVDGISCGYADLFVDLSFVNVVESTDPGPGAPYTPPQYEVGFAADPTSLSYGVGYATYANSGDYFSNILGNTLNGLGPIIDPGPSDPLLGAIYPAAYYGVIGDLSTHVVYNSLATPDPISGEWYDSNGFEENIAALANSYHNTGYNVYMISLGVEELPAVGSIYYWYGPPIH